MAKCSLLKPFVILTILALLSSVLSIKKLKKVDNSKQSCSSTAPTYTSITLNVDTKSGDCTASQSADFATRLALKNYYTTCNVVDTWGPWPKLYSQATIPNNCTGDQQDWMRGRVLGAISQIVAQKFNYCHHHSPHWLPPNDSTNRIPLNPDNIATGNGAAGICSLGYFPDPNNTASYDAGWSGIDCSHFSCFTYNFSFGAFLNTNVSTQACDQSPAAMAVSSFLPFTRDQQNQFLPGDLLYIAANSSANPLSISHVIIWTGYKVGDPGFSQDVIVSHLDPSQQSTYNNAITASLNAGKPVYIIADSHWAGPNYRPFISWYYSAFSHARRIIGKEQYANQAPKTGMNLTSSGCTVPQ